MSECFHNIGNVLQTAKLQLFLHITKKRTKISAERQFRGRPKAYSLEDAPLALQDAALEIFFETRIRSFRATKIIKNLEKLFCFCL